MIYKTFQGKKLSALGMGCMRLPMKENKIDMAETRKMVSYAMEKGINYFDTAWGYHDGQSELVMGEVLSEYQRDKFYLASKFPGYDLSNMGKVKEIFEKQLEKCRVDYFDFYLFHNVCELNIEQYLDDERYGTYTYLIEQKRCGRIKHLGFSAHGNFDTMKLFLEAYGKDMEFCQLQVNWLDWEFQNAREKVELVKSYGIPVWVMEPVRGGSLVNLGDEYSAKLKQYRPNATNAEWAFRFLQSLDVVVTLSGMSSFEQIKQNIATYENEMPLNDDEMNMLVSIAREMTGKDTIPCTSCRYCTAHCPKGINIPFMIKLYNEHIYSGGGFIAPMALASFNKDKTPSACIGCRACEAVCPQNIKISEMMSDFVSKLK